MKNSFPKHDLQLDIGIATSIFGLVLNPFWKRALHIHIATCRYIFIFIYIFIYMHLNTL